MASRAVVFRPVNTDDVSKTPFEANTTFKYSDADVDVVNKIRFHLKNIYKTGNIKVGHAGTLDPLATGLLIVCVGKYTQRINL